MKSPARAALLALALAPWPALAGGWEWAEPTRLAVAECSRFPWVSDLPMVPETARLLERAAVAGLGLPPSSLHRWSNGSADAFQAWLGELSASAGGGTNLVLYFSTHQKPDGRMKFSEGPDLAPRALVEALNGLAAVHPRVLFLNDTCHAAVIERAGSFRANVARLHACREDELAADVVFSAAPFGVEAFARPSRAFLRDGTGWDPKGLSLLGLFGLRAGVEAAQGGAGALDLRRFFEAMVGARNAYNRDVRHARAQHPVLLPPDANFALVRRKP